MVNTLDNIVSVCVSIRMSSVCTCLLHFGCISVHVRACRRVHLYLSVQMWVYRLIPGSLGTVLIDSSVPGCHGDDDGCVLGYHGDRCLGVLSACII